MSAAQQVEPDWRNMFDTPEVRAEVRKQRRAALLKAIEGEEIGMWAYASERWALRKYPDLIIFGYVYYSESDMHARMSSVVRRLKRLRELVKEK